VRSAENSIGPGQQFFAPDGNTIIVQGNTARRIGLKARRGPLHGPANLAQYDQRFIAKIYPLRHNAKLMVKSGSTNGNSFAG
jgi:hypothetical protein